MTETVPFLKPYVDALKAGDPLPPYARRELGFGTPGGCRRAGRLPRVRRRRRHHRPGRRASAATGWRCGRTRAEVVVEFADGTGWSADAIAEVWPKQFAAAQQTVGQQFPEPPK